MNIPPHDAQKIAENAMELFGGKESFFAAADKDLAEINDRWNQNIEVIGRILRAHLFLEYYMSEYLSKANPRLESLTESRLSFSQKLSLLDSSNPDIAFILPGIKRLNAIRNRLAHNLSAQVTEDDKTIFLACERFAAMRKAKAQTNTVGESPLEVLEDFARHTYMPFTYEFSPLTKAIEAAVQHVHGRDLTTPCT